MNAPACWPPFARLAHELEAARPRGDDAHAVEPRQPAARVTTHPDKRASNLARGGRP